MTKADYEPKSIVRVAFVYEGPPAGLEPITKAFNDLKPINAKQETTDFVGLGDLLGVGEDSPGCNPGINIITHPVSINTHNIEAQRAAFTALNDFTFRYPEFSYGYIAFEGYAMQGVKAVPDGSSAVSDRQYNILV
jgi:hypothetical protein